MGCDIHAAIEVFDAVSGKWTALLHPNEDFGKYDDEPELTPRLEIGRDYDIFAVLGNVRNGAGFAGCTLGTGFDFISDNRGVPDDISPEGRSVLSNEHSPTWVALPEILAFDWTRETLKTGIVNEKEFEEWDRLKEWEPGPRSYSGGVFGQNFRHISPDEMRARIARKRPSRAISGSLDLTATENDGLTYYTRLEWKEGYATACRKMWTQILPKMLRAAVLCGHPEYVRLVMDFDS